jgi:hypothetical protein
METARTIDTHRNVNLRSINARSRNGELKTAAATTAQAAPDVSAAFGQRTRRSGRPRGPDCGTPFAVPRKTPSATRPIKQLFIVGGGHHWV